MSGDAPQFPGCALPFGLGFMAFTAILVLSLAVGFAALSLIFGNLPPGSQGLAPGQRPPGAAGGVVSGATIGTGATIPPISDRFFTGGTITTRMSGAFALNGSLPIDAVRSYAQDGLGWIDFIQGKREVLVAINEPGDSVTVADGTTSATAVDDDCIWNVQVTASMITGRVSCPSMEVMKDGEPAGTSSLELDFTASS